LTLWLMLAAAAQGVIAQGHVHQRFLRTTALDGAIASALAPDDDGAPGDRAGRETAACALCQVLGAGSAPLVSAPRFDVPFAALCCTIGEESPRPLTVSAVSHSWTSRGPPSI
jgi:hypothetical protein